MFYRNNNTPNQCGIDGGISVRLTNLAHSPEASEPRRWAALHLWAVRKQHSAVEFWQVRKLRALLLLTGLGMVWLVVVVMTISPVTHQVTLSFLCATNDGSCEVIGWEITNRLSREVWWRIQTGGTNYPGSLTLECNDGINYQSGVWHGMGQYSREPPVKALGSYRPMYVNRDVHVKSGEQVWLVWSDRPKSTPVPNSALNEWRLNLSYFLDRHGWKRAGVLFRPTSNDPHVEELVAP